MNLEYNSLNYSFLILKIFNNTYACLPSDALIELQVPFQNGNSSIPFTRLRSPKFSIPLCPVYIVETSSSVPFR